MFRSIGTTEATTRTRSDIRISVIFVFDKKSALDSVINSGWEFGGQATAAAKTGDKGGAVQGAVAVAAGVWMYQLTDKGLALEATVKGTKYWKDSDLNKG